MISNMNKERINNIIYHKIKEIENYLYTVKKDIHVAVMGCAVNGPGEAREADLGVAGGIKEAIL